MAGELELEVEPSKEETERIRKEETFLIKMLKELDVASRKGEARKEKERSKKKGKPDPKMRKMTSFFNRVQPPRTNIQVEQHEEMEWEEQEDVMSDMDKDGEVQRHGYQTEEQNRTAWRKLKKEKEDSLR